MSLYRTPGAEAISTRKANAFAGWGNRNEPNRIEPVAKPTFDVPFQLEPGEGIFTVGSCFARNVEAELLRLGYRLPMRDIFSTPEFQDFDLASINNFGTPSIFNEFAWALGARDFDPAQHFVQTGEGLYADLHLVPSSRPAPLDVLMRRREAIKAAYRTVLDCRVIIMTLGLSEVWFDNETGYYLNNIPRPSVMRAHPDRFSLHTLDFEEAYGYLRDTMELLRAKCRKDLRVILTVSPVPLNTTHRNEDVMVANTYSKSLLRVVAETIRAKYDFVAYYPSYESVILSDRKLAWKEDMVHVTEGIVAFEVSRMVAAYTGQELDDPKSDLEEAIDRAATLSGAGQHAGAIEVLMPFRSEVAAIIAIAASHRAMGNADAAVTMLAALVHPRLKSAPVWEALIAAQCDAGRTAEAEHATISWMKAMPGWAPYAARKGFELLSPLDLERAERIAQIA